MKCREIAAAVETLAPRHLAYEWDNVGLLCGDPEQDVTKVLLTLDLDIGVVEEAIREGAQMIIGHHPILFDGALKSVTAQTPEGRLLRCLIQNNISYYAAHTNLDVAKGGLNDFLARKLGLKNIELLEAIDVEGEGIGRIGDLDTPITLSALAQRVKKEWGVCNLRYAGDEAGLVSHIAVNSGGGTSLIDSARANHADVFITGDFKYAQIRSCLDHGMKIIDVGHYDSEIFVCDILAEYLPAKIGQEVTLIRSRANTNVVSFL